MRFARTISALFLVASLAGCDFLDGLFTDNTSTSSGLADEPTTPDTTPDVTPVPNDDSSSTPTDDTSTTPPSCPQSCDDGNPCTLDTCVDNGCAHEAIDDAALACVDDVTLLRCDAGESSELRCADACLSAGYNAYAGCDEAETGCPCGWVFATCNPGAIACVGYTRFIAMCEEASEAGTSENVWHAYDCDVVCAEAGYGPAITCGVDLDDFSSSVCYCEDRCVPGCPSGSICYDGVCFELGSPPPPSGDECAADFECGYQEACDGGRCEPVECKIDSDCGYCEQCNSHYCDSCGTDSDGDCACY